MQTVTVTSTQFQIDVVGPKGFSIFGATPEIARGAAAKALRELPGRSLNEVGMVERTEQKLLPPVRR